MRALLALLLFASSALQEGEKLFLDNNPQQAQPLLEQALSESPQEERIYLYLGIVYEQLGDAKNALQVLRRGLEVAKQYRDLFYYNIGNNLFKQGELTLAEEMYTKALEANRRLEDAYLNRANSRLKLERLAEAREDYIGFLRLAPGSPQREEIEKLIALLGGILEQEEQKRQEQALKQKALLDEVLSTLQNASENAKNLSAGSEKIEERYEDIDIAD